MFSFQHCNLVIFDLQAYNGRCLPKTVPKPFVKPSSSADVFHPDWHFMARLSSFMLKSEFSQKTWYFP